MPTAENAAAPAPESLISTSPLPERSISHNASQRWRVAGLMLVLTVAFLPSISSSLLRLSGVQFNYSDVLLRYRYFDGLLRQLTCLALLTYVVRQNGQKFSDLGLVFRASDVFHGLLLWAGARLCYRLAYPSILSICELLGWHRTAPYLPSLALGLGLLTFCFVVVNPIYEEMIVRAFLMSETINLTGSSGLAVLFSVLLQTSYHLYQGVPYALVAASNF